VSASRRPLTWVLVGILFLLHFVLHVGFGIGRAAPDLLTIGLLLVAREVGLGTAAAVGLFFGLLEDSLSVLAFGANSVALTTVGILGAFTRDLFVGDSRIFVVSYLFVGKLVRDFAHWVLVGSELRRPFAEQVVVQGGVGALYVAAIGLGLTYLIRMTAES
jgi:cell shape-determining protein MreD